MKGKYIIFEGSDGTGKSSISKIVQEKLTKKFGDRVIHTRHPGATQIGSELRHLIKHSDCEIGAMTERFMLLCDNCAFVEQILIPSLKEDKIVLADRCNFISDYPYGLSLGVTYKKIKDVHDSLKTMDIPKADAAIVYCCPWSVAKTRISGDMVDGKVVKCRIESRGDKYFEDVVKYYYDMVDFFDNPTKRAVLQHVNKIKHVDATKTLEESVIDTMKIIDEIIGE